MATAEDSTHYDMTPAVVTMSPPLSAWSTTLVTAVSASMLQPVAAAETTEEEVSGIINFPRPATIFAAVCASIFTAVGIGGKSLNPKLLIKGKFIQSRLRG